MKYIMSGCLDTGPMCRVALHSSYARRQSGDALIEPIKIFTTVLRYILKDVWEGQAGSMSLFGESKTSGKVLKFGDVVVIAYPVQSALKSVCKDIVH